MGRSDRGSASVWKVIHIAADREVAEAAQAVLAREGLLVVLRPLHLAAGGRQPVEILVPRSEAEEASRILQGVSGDHRVGGDA